MDAVSDAAADVSSDERVGELSEPLFESEIVTTRSGPLVPMECESVAEDEVPSRPLGLEIETEPGGSDERLGSFPSTMLLMASTSSFGLESASATRLDFPCTYLISDVYSAM